MHCGRGKDAHVVAPFSLKFGKVLWIFVQWSLLCLLEGQCWREQGKENVSSHGAGDWKGLWCGLFEIGGSKSPRACAAQIVTKFCYLSTFASRR